MSKNNNDFNNKEKIEYQSLDYIMSDRFARYSKYIIQQRALPDVRDGLKPVQRRILFSMNELGLQYNKSFKKSARVVGDVIGKYHPHGDSSIYEALVRMSQDWKMNMPLIEMHGNKGSIDDDPAAAMRYTEAKLSKISSLLLDELDKDTIPFSLNFDDTEKEPTVLPAYIPNLLLNGSKGIAAGFATEIPPHNLGELLDAIIAKIRNPELSLKGLMKYIKGPDFPTGGIVYGMKGIENSFERGQGRITICSKYFINETAKEKNVIITEIPYGVIKSKLVRQIDELRISSNLSGIKEVRDETDRDGISIVISLDKEANVDAIMNFLLQKTDIKVYYTYNMISIVDNAPKILGIDRMINAYIDHIKNVKTKSITFDLNKAKKRLEIIEGLIRVTQISDQVIKVIRETEGGKQSVIEQLVNKLQFTVIQATAIAELRLYRLNKTDASIYLKEREDLKEKINFFNLLLTNSEEFDNYLISMFKKIKQEYAIKRRTEIAEGDLSISINQESLIKSEPCWISLSNGGYLKSFSNRIYESNEISSFGVKDDEEIIYINKSNMINKLLIFTSKGNYAIVPVYKIKEAKWKEVGQHITDFVPLSSDEKIVSIIDVESFKTNAYVVLVTKLGIGKRVPLKDFEASRISNTLRAISFKKNNDELINAKITNGIQDVIIITNTAHCVKFSENELPILSPKASGNTLIKIEHNWVTAFGIASNNDSIVLLSGKNKYKIIQFSLLSSTTRATKGNQIFKNINARSVIRDVFVNQKINLISNNQNELELIVFDKNNKIHDINSDFYKFSSSSNGNVYPIMNFDLNSNNEFFKVTFNKEINQKIMDDAQEKIESIEEKIDEKKIDEILKKLKI